MMIGRPSTPPWPTSVGPPSCFRRPGSIATPVPESVDERRSGVSQVDVEEDLIGQAWRAVTEGDPAASASCPPPPEVTGAPGRLPSAFAVEELAVASVATALLSAAALAGHRGGPVPTVTVDRGHVADAVRSERFFSVGDVPPAPASPRCRASGQRRTGG